MTGRERRLVRVEGVVQGVGFRPFVYALALRLGVAGRVRNNSSGVLLDVEADPDTLDRFVAAVRAEAPPLASVEKVEATIADPTGWEGFEIIASEVEERRNTLVSGDSATCADCLAELDDPADRRYQYPFINCTNCGPRFTIVKDVPYDRPFTTMAGFPMCTLCEVEYQNPLDRRFHAQPVCCPACGPRLALVDSTGRPLPGPALPTAAAMLRDGAVLAVKGLGGYHLAVLATDEPAAATLRSRKHREDKPFAVMVPTVDSARELCRIDAAAQALLTDRRRPIVLSDRIDGMALAKSVAPGNRQLGLMLPYAPLHFLLLRAVGGPIVLTSGNISDEPIAYEDADALARLGKIADAFLTHDRPIHIRTDDSVARSVGGRPMMIRRSRGYVPEPLTLRREAPRPLLACGAELKNTFCLAKGHHAFLSHHIGDLENYQTLRSYTEGIAHFQRLFDIDPVVVAHDLHPEYLSTKYAVELENVELVGVQHHHAHIASCLADNGESGPVIGVAFDGTGFGPDGTIWGGEFLVADLADYTRVGRLQLVPLPGGAAAIKNPWRMAAAYLNAARIPDFPPLSQRHEADWSTVVAMATRGINSPLTSSAGRLLDAVAAIVGLRDAINYEGQAAIELEQLADRSEKSAYRLGIRDTEIQGVDLVRAVVDDVRAGIAAPLIAARVHNGLIEVVVRMCARLRDQTGLATVALSGGVFQNLLLVNGIATDLTSAGFRVLTHSRVPPNDGGISLGQAAIATARM